MFRTFARRAGADAVPIFRCEIINPEGKPALILKAGISPDELAQEFKKTARFCARRPQPIGWSMLRE